MALKKKKCKHLNVQEYTECCMDCGVNIYSSDADDQWLYWDDDDGEKIYDLEEYVIKLEKKLTKKKKKK